MKPIKNLCELDEYAFARDIMLRELDHISYPNVGEEIFDAALSTVNNDFIRDISITVVNNLDSELS